MAAMTIVFCISWDCVKPKNSSYTTTSIAEVCNLLRFLSTITISLPFVTDSKTVSKIYSLIFKVELVPSLSLQE